MALLIVPIFAVYLHYRVAEAFVAQASGAARRRTAPRTHYDALGIAPDANIREIRLAYKKLIDRTASPAERESLAVGYHVLTNESRRAAYDRKLARAAVLRRRARRQRAPGIVSRAVHRRGRDGDRGGVAVRAASRGAGLNLTKLPAAADPLIVMLLLTLPFYGPLVEKLPFVGDRGFDGQTPIIVLGRDERESRRRTAGDVR